jgi:nucleotide-binding universal stress UspA family protein
MRPPIRRLVAGVATLRPDDPVLAAALRLAAATRAELHLLFVAEEASRTPAAVQLRLLREAAEAAAPGAASTGRVVCRVVGGAAAQRLLDVAEEVDADLLIVGPTRRGTLAGVVLGTTAGRVIRSARIPVLVVRAPLPDGSLRVLLTTDLSHHSAYAHARGGSLARALSRAEPVMRSLFVEPPAVPEIPGAQPDFSAEREFLDFLRAEVPLPATTPRVRAGDPALEILREAGEWADLLVLGTHARRGAQRLLLGSVAEAVLRHAPCATLVIPPLRPYRMAADPTAAPALEAAVPA